MKCLAMAHPNIAVVKYWGKRDLPLNLPSTCSVSVTLSGFRTITSVHWGTSRDRVLMGGRPASRSVAHRVLGFLDLLDPHRPPCHVESENNFPTSAGLASSSSAFAALALAASRASGRNLSVRELSVLARRGSGSACRSIPGGFVYWRKGSLPDGSDSHAVQIAPEDHWDLRVVVAVVDPGPKSIASTAGMLHSAATSPCFPVFLEKSGQLATMAREAIATRNHVQLFHAMEESTLLMQATMTTALPPIFYSKPASLAIIRQVYEMRRDGIPCGWTMDAGPNVKIFCLPRVLEGVVARIRPHAVDVHALSPGGAARLLECSP